MPGRTSGEVMLLRRKPVKQDVNGSPTRVVRRIAPKIIGGRKAGKFIPGRRAGKDHARSQCPLRGERAAWIRNAEGCTLEKG
ncbi:hypothetical protein BG32_02285 [Mesotoga sp. HF07.pep.5.2.highcov]|nr:hypothetical protein BG32_02285 [Mesotoga sp. HF07.pep.5.2.highcov]